MSSPNVEVLKKIKSTKIPSQCNISTVVHSFKNVWSNYSKKIVKILKDIYEEFLPMMEWRTSSHAAFQSMTTDLSEILCCDSYLPMITRKNWDTADYGWYVMLTIKRMTSISSTEVEDLNEVKEFKPV